MQVVDIGDRIVDDTVLDNFDPENLCHDKCWAIALHDLDLSLMEFAMTFVSESLLPRLLHLQVVDCGAPCGEIRTAGLH